MSQSPIQVKEPILSQPQFNAVSGLSDVTTNNYIARGILESAQIGGRQIKGIRLFTLEQAYGGRLIADLVKTQKIPASDAAKIAKTAIDLLNKGGFLEHWIRAVDANRNMVAAYLMDAWLDDCYTAEIISGDKDGLPDFSIRKVKQFLGHPFMMVRLDRPFVDCYRKCLSILKPSA
jgi:hypothetical protein